MRSFKELWPDINTPGHNPLGQNPRWVARPDKTHRITRRQLFFWTRRLRPPILKFSFRNPFCNRKRHRIHCVLILLYSLFLPLTGGSDPGGLCPGEFMSANLKEHAYSGNSREYDCCDDRHSCAPVWTKTRNIHGAIGNNLFAWLWRLDVSVRGQLSMDHNGTGGQSMTHEYMLIW